ncbi:MAG TPA: hypothetical protein VFY93_00830 [Planctomycetota bacterium]|nr:hypothetical protein [Planctomycetota bacterium]
MEPAESAPRCANQVHAHTGGGAPEPIQVCSCAAGLIHMLDCPVELGLACAFFRQIEGPPAALDAVAADEIHSRLMHDYLSRAYYHRVRSLAPAGNPWLRRREELYAFYATVELEGREPLEDEEGYERERERLNGLRREREEARKAREQMTREEKARERARLGIKTVVEKAQEAVALRSAETPETEAGGPGGEEPAPAQDASSEGAPPRRRRRRRRRRSGGGGGGGGPPAPPA